MPPSSIRHARRNPFNLGDVVGHPDHQKLQGIVIGTNGKWVKYKVLGRTLQGGKPYIVKFAHQKLFLIMTLEQRIEMAQKIMAARAAEQNTLGAKLRRVGTWAKNLIAKTAPQSAATSAA